MTGGAIALLWLGMRVVMGGGTTASGTGNIPAVVGLVLVTHTVYLTACYGMLRAPQFESGGFAAQKWTVSAWAILFRLLAAPMAPVLTDDPFRYQWEGRIQAEGRNPYATRPADLGDNQVPGKDFKAVYGPVVELAERIAWQIGGRDDVRWMKLPAIVADLAILVVIGHFWPDRLLLYAWSPVAILEFWGQGHNDALAVLFVTLALAAPGAGWWLGLAAAAKWWPLVLVPALARSWRDWVIAPLVPLLCLWPFVDGLTVENLRFTTGFLGGWRNNDALFGLLLALSPNEYRAKHLAFAAVAAAGLIAARWPTADANSRPARGLGVVAAMLAVSSNVHPWYLSWPLPFLISVPWLPVLTWAATMPLAYEAVIRWQILGDWGASSWVRWAIYLPVVAATVMAAIRRLASSGAGSNSKH